MRSKNPVTQLQCVRHVYEESMADSFFSGLDAIDRGVVSARMFSNPRTPILSSGTLMFWSS